MGEFPMLKPRLVSGSALYQRQRLSVVSSKEHDDFGEAT